MARTRSLSAGTRLGPYEILSPLGAGGMGEVYRARDTRLDRIVAVKISQEQFTDRFVRDMNGEAVAQRIFQDGKRSHALGVNQTPTFYVNGTQLMGAQPFAQFQAAIEAALAKK